MAEFDSAKLETPEGRDAVLTEALTLVEGLFPNVGGVGQLSKTQLDQQMSGILNTLDLVFTQIGAMQLFMAATPDANFTASTGQGPIGYSSGEVAIFKSAFARLDVLRQIYQGLVAQGSSPEDFRAFPKQIWGTGVH